MIEIKGIQFENKGAELMLLAILQKVKERFPNVSIALPVHDSSPYLNRVKLGTYQKLSLRKGKMDLNCLSYYFPKYLKMLFLKFGIIFENDIDIVLDASGFAYGDQWDDIAVHRMISELIRYKTHGKKYIFLAQAFGPFTSPKTSIKINKYLNLADLVIARETDSYKFLSNVMSDNSNIKVYTDFTNLISGIESKSLAFAKGSFLIIPNNNMLRTGNNNSVWSNVYEEILVDLAKGACSRGYKVILLNHEGDQDQKICQRISKMAGDLEIINDTNPLFIKGIIGTAAAVVSSRFHGCVSALSQGVPCAGTSWSHKYERLFEEYGVSSWLIPDNIKDISSLLDSLLNDPAAKEKIVTTSKKLKIQSSKMWEDVFNVISTDTKMLSCFHETTN